MTPNSSPNLNLYGEAELMDMLEANRAAGLVSDPEREVASSHLGQLAAEVIAQTDPLANLEAGFKHKLNLSYVHIGELLAPTGMGITPPELTDLAEAGADFSALAKAHASMESLGMEPELVFAPTLRLDQWKQVYQSLQDNLRTNHDARIKNGGLWVAEDVQSHWDELMAQTAANGAHAFTASDGTQWQVVLVPGTDKPPVTNLDHSGKADHDRLHPELSKQLERLSPDPDTFIFNSQAIHPTIPAYLTLQATRLHTSEPPLDSQTYTWLQGEFTESSDLQAPNGYWSPDYGQVFVGWSSVGFRSGSLGGRLPVWG